MKTEAVEGLGRILLRKTGLSHFVSSRYRVSPVNGFDPLRGAN